MFESKISDALFTKTQQRVLGILYGKPDQSFYLNEIVRLADVGKGSVKRELDKLENAELITTFKRGNQKHFQANYDSPVFTDLKGLVGKTLGALEIIKDGLIPLTTDLEQAFIYGPIDHDTDEAASEINLILVSDRLTYGQVKPVIEKIQQDTGKRLKPIVLSINEYAERVTKPDSFIAWVMEQPKLWLLDGRNR